MMVPRLVMTMEAVCLVIYLEHQAGRERERELEVREDQVISLLVVYTEKEKRCLKEAAKQDADELIVRRQCIAADMLKN